MIKYNPKNWVKLIFQYNKSDTFRKMIWVLLLFGIYASLVVYFAGHFPEFFPFKSSTKVHSLLGFVISLILVFRTNTAYDRWWEGRKHWGALVNISRNFSIKISSMIDSSDKETRSFFEITIINYTFAVKEHLRNGVIPKEIVDLPRVSSQEILEKEHIPNFLALQMNVKVNQLLKQGKITGDQFIVLDKELKSFTDIVGACERIKNTPIPYSYNIFLKKFIFIYCITLPYAFASDFGYITSIISMMVLYVLGSLELLAEEIEDPFGTDTNDLPTDQLAEKIQQNVSEIFSS